MTHEKSSSPILCWIASRNRSPRVHPLDPASTQAIVGSQLVPAPGLERAADGQIRSDEAGPEGDPYRGEEMFGRHG